MSLGPGLEVDLTIEDLVAECEERLEPLGQWAYRCHEASLHLVRADNLLPEARVARGVCDGVGAQHSWVVIGDDCYDPEALIIDPTLWSYDGEVDGIWTGKLGRHKPHGAGNIFAWGRPRPAAPGQAIELKAKTPLSGEAIRFLSILGPLDREGWSVLASYAPVEGWPAGEILAAIDDTFGGGIVPVDRIGMLTDRNPGGLYLKEDTDGS